MEKKSTYFQNLDGLRFVASVFVIIGHCQHYVEALDKTGHFYAPFSDKMAGFGVDFFFVLSGFLIGFLLFDEIERTQTVAIRKFYIRRILRLWPLYFLVGTLSIIFGNFLAYLVNYPFPPQTTAEMGKNLFHLFTFSTNFQIVWHQSNAYTSGFLGHFWSLSVEEQFYLFFAPLVLFLHRRGVSWLSFCLFIGVGFAAYLFISDWFIQIFHTIHRLFHFGLGIGYAYFVLRGWHLPRLTQPIWAEKALQWTFVSMACFYLFGKIYFVADERILNGIVAVGFVATAIHRHSILSLEQRWVKYLGKISFGIYIFHLFCVEFSAKILLHDVGMSTQSVWFHVAFVVLTSILSFSLATLSFEYFEKPFLNLRSRFRA